MSVSRCLRHIKGHLVLCTVIILASTAFADAGQTYDNLKGALGALRQLQAQSTAEKPVLVEPPTYFSPPAPIPDPFLDPPAKTTPPDTTRSASPPPSSDGTSTGTNVTVDVRPGNQTSRSTGTSVAGSSRDSKDTVFTSRNIIIIAVAVGVGLILILAAILCVWCRYSDRLKAPPVAKMDMETGVVALHRGTPRSAAAPYVSPEPSDTSTRLDAGGTVVRSPVAKPPQQHPSPVQESKAWTLVSEIPANRQEGPLLATATMQQVNITSTQGSDMRSIRTTSTLVSESSQSIHSTATVDQQVRSPRNSTRSLETLPQPSLNAPNLPALPPTGVSSGQTLSASGPISGFIGGTHAANRGGGAGAVPASGDAFVAVIGYGILAVSVGVAREIIEAGDRVVANHARCRRIIVRIQLMQPLLVKLQETLKGPDPPQDIDPMLLHLKGVYEDCKDTILKWCDKSNSWKAVIKNLVRSRAFQDEFVDLNERLSNSYNDITLAINVNSLAGGSAMAFRPPTPQAREAEAEADLREDLQNIASELLQRGWAELSGDEQGMVKELYLGHGLDLEQLLKQAKKSWREDKVKDLRVPWQQLQVIEEVGSGGYGTVYLAKWAGSEVAVKKFSATIVTERVRKDLEREAYIMSQLHHPNVARFFGMVMEHPHYALVMQYYPHGTLLNLLHNDNIPLTWPERYHLAADVAQGMCYLHSRPVEAIVHGDLKTTNLLIDNDGRVVITDFGLAKVKTITKTIVPGSAGVSACYCAPELLVGTVNVTRTQASDVYSYGMILFEIATREVPFQGLDIHLVYDHIRRGVRPEIPSDVPRDFADLISWCWSQKSTERPSFEQVAARLTTFL